MKFNRIKSSLSQSNLPKTVALTIGVLAIIFSIRFIVLAWTEPPQAPPQGNVPAPINVGSITQTKAGGLNLGGNLNLQGNKLIIYAGDGEIYRSGGQIVYQADDNWYWYSSWDGHDEMTLHYRDGLRLRSNLDADSLSARNQVCIRGDCKTSWPAGGISSCADCDPRFAFKSHGHGLTNCGWTGWSKGYPRCPSGQVVNGMDCVDETDWDPCEEGGAYKGGLLFRFYCCSVQ